MIYLTQSNEIVGYNLYLDIVKARQGAVGSVNAKLIHIYPLELPTPSGLINSYLKTQIGF